MIAVTPQQILALASSGLMPAAVDSTVRIELHEWNQYGAIYAVLYADGEAQRAAIVNAQGTVYIADVGLQGGSVIDKLEGAVDAITGRWGGV